MLNTLDEENKWTPVTITKGSWILLHTRKRKTQHPNEFLDNWKARVKDFRLLGSQKTIREVLVQHVYMHNYHSLLGLKDYPCASLIVSHYHSPSKTCFLSIYLLVLCLFFEHLHLISFLYLFCVDLYPSSYEDWQSVQSIVGAINYVHLFIGE